MIHSFIESWPLFEETYLAGWLLALLLALAGVVVVARDRVFVAAAVSQASLLGVGVGLWLAHWPEAPSWVAHAAHPAVLAVALAVLAALLTDAPGRADAGQAVTGWTFLAAASGSVLLLTHTPIALKEIHERMASGVIGASWNDVAVFATLAGLALLLAISYHRPLALLILDRQMALALGMRVWRWEVLLAVWLGLVLGVGIRACGLLYVFGCLVLPGIAARSLCRRFASMFVVAPVLGLLAAGAGFLLANHYDHPPAQMTVSLLAAVAAVAWFARKLLR